MRRARVAARTGPAGHHQLELRGEDERLAAATIALPVRERAHVSGWVLEERGERAVSGQRGIDVARERVPGEERGALEIGAGRSARERSAMRRGRRDVDAASRRAPRFARAAAAACRSRSRPRRARRRSRRRRTRGPSQSPSSRSDPRGHDGTGCRHPPREPWPRRDPGRWRRARIGVPAAAGRVAHAPARASERVGHRLHRGDPASGCRGQRARVTAGPAGGFEGMQPAQESDPAPGNRGIEDGYERIAGRRSRSSCSRASPPAEETALEGQLAQRPAEPPSATGASKLSKCSIPMTTSWPSPVVDAFASTTASPPVPAARPSTLCARKDAAPRPRSSSLRRSRARLRRSGREESPSPAVPPSHSDRSSSAEDAVCLASALRAEPPDPAGKGARELRLRLSRSAATELARVAPDATTVIWIDEPPGDREDPARMATCRIGSPHSR